MLCPEQYTVQWRCSHDSHQPHCPSPSRWIIFIFLIFTHTFDTSSFWWKLFHRGCWAMHLLINIDKKSSGNRKDPKSNSEWLVWVHTETIASAICCPVWTLSKPSLDYDGPLVSGCLIKIHLAPCGLQLLHHSFHHSSKTSRVQIISLHLIYASTVLATKSTMSSLSVLPQVSLSAWLNMANAIKYE